MKQKIPFPEQRKIYQEQIEKSLDQALQKCDLPQKEVVDAMRYSLLGGGKRIRAILVLEFARCCGLDPAQAMPFACAMEMIHAYSLIHDDLPCMDDDALRRGKPSCHKKFGEATALLAGDGLLTCAFETAAGVPDSIPAANVLAAMRYLSASAGYRGMIGGQVIDLAIEGKAVQVEELANMYALKTGALLKASCVIGCLLAGRVDLQKKAEDYAQYLGLAFQIIDDILDVTGNETILGKPVGSDAGNDKTTYVALYGLEKAGEIAQEYTQKALLELEELGFSGGFLTLLTKALLNRLQ